MKIDKYKQVVKSTRFSDEAFNTPPERIYRRNHRPLFESKENPEKLKQKILRAFNDQPNPDLEQELRELRKNQSHHTPGTGEDIKKAFNDSPAPDEEWLGEGTAREAGDLPETEQIRRAFNDSPNAMPQEKNLQESISATIQDITFIGESQDLEEDYSVVGTLIDPRKETRNGRTYPLSVLQQIVGKKLWENGKIFLSHTARKAGDLSKLLGRVKNMWLTQDGKLKFEALLSGKIIEKIPGLANALSNRLIDVSLAGNGKTVRENGKERVVSLNDVSLDLLGKESPAAGGSGIEKITQQ